MKRLPLALLLVALVACNGKKRGECAAMTDALAPVSAGAHKALERYDRSEMARYAKAVGEAKTKIEALKLTDEKLAGYRIEVLRLLEMNLAMLARLDAPAAGIPGTHVPTPSEVKEKGAVLDAIKAYCE